MSTANRVYIARLAGVAVFDPNGDQVGRVRDAVARIRAGRQPPEVVGLVAEMPMRRRIFLSINRVTSIDAEAVVLGTGTLNLRRFEKRPSELLVLETLLDRHVTIDPDGQAAVVVDVAMECGRGGEWSLSRVAVREHTGRLSRRGHVSQVEWLQVRGLTGLPEAQGTAGLLAVLDDLRPADLANALQDLPDARRNEVAAALDDDRLADVLEELPEHDQVEILAALGRERAADVLEEMDPDDAADLLNELPPPEQDVLLDLMEPDEADPVRQLLNYTARHRRQRDDLRAGDHGAGRDGRRGAGPHPRTAALPGRRRTGLRRPAADGHPDRPLPRHGALPAAAARAAGRPARRAGGQRHRPAAAEHPPAGDHPADGDVRPGRRCP